MHEGAFPTALQELDQVYLLSAMPSLPQRARPMNGPVHSRAFGSFALWASGYPVRAIASTKDAFAVARDTGAAAGDRVIICWWSGNLNLLLREATTAQAFSDEANRSLLSMACLV